MFEAIKGISVRIFTFFSVAYIKYVFRTSRIIISGNSEYYENIGESKDKYVICFWHGSSYCYYPLLKDNGISIITTLSYRGAYISEICRRFGYEPIRLPDDSSESGDFFNLKDIVNKIKGKHVGITLDGPTGPYRVPKKFALVTSLVTKKKILLISVRVEKKIQSKKRWDKFIIPLPHNTIEFTFHEPLAVKKDGFEDAAREIIDIMGHE